MTPGPERPGRPLGNYELADGLCAVSGAIRELRRVHVEHYETLIPHVFMGDVLAHAGALCRIGAKDEEYVEVAAILRMLEQGMAYGSRETRGVIAMSFVADSQHEVFYHTLAYGFGPRLRRAAMPATD